MAGAQEPGSGRVRREIDGTVNPPRGRRRGRGNPPAVSRSREPEPISTRLQRIAEQARGAPEMAFTSLAHHIDLDLLREAFRRTRKDGAPGVDGRTAAEYAEDLEGNLRGLLERVRSGTYRAPPVRRAHIPKGKGSERRPIGIPTFEDKVLQRAVLMVLEAVSEQDFLPGSYGFRPGRSAHQALDSLRAQARAMRGCWLLEVDIRQFFDTLDHGHLRDFVRQRVRDGVLLRLIGKWLAAGVLEAGRLVRPETGTPQGGVISPWLANVYLHEVLDRWFVEVVQPRLRGRAFWIRYADDFVLGFEHEHDARRVWEVLPKRFAKYGLALHPDKTQLVDFRHPARRREESSAPNGRPGAFELLGFTHFWGRTRSGAWAIRTTTASRSFTRSIKSVRAYCKTRRHRPIPEQHQALLRKLRGHYAYFGCSGDRSRLCTFRHEMFRAWQKWLNRRSHGTNMPWPRFNRMLQRYPLPLPPSAAHRLAAYP